MMMAGGGGAPISDLPLGALINVGTDGGAGTPNYEIADKDNFVHGGVVLVRKNIHSQSIYGSKYAYYTGSTLDNKMTSIYNSYPEKLKNKIMDATFFLYKNGSITRKVFALSCTMVGFGTNNSTTEGKALQRYNSNANRIKTYNGSVNSWWLSSRSYDERLRYVDTNGKITGSASQDKNYGVVPAFVIPGDTLSKLTPNTDGLYNLIL
jgi:hypothetical protein